MNSIKPIYTISGKVYESDFMIFPDIADKQISRSDIQHLKSDLTDKILGIVTTPEIGAIIIDVLPSGMELLELLTRTRNLLDCLDIQEYESQTLNA